MDTEVKAGFAKRKQLVAEHVAYRSKQLQGTKIIINRRVQAQEAQHNLYYASRQVHAAQSKVDNDRAVGVMLDAIQASIWHGGLTTKQEVSTEHLETPACAPPIKPVSQKYY